VQERSDGTHSMSGVKVSAALSNAFSQTIRTVD
jgi:hypothetical protein